MSIHVGDREISEIYFGGEKISEAYFGSDLVYRSGPLYQSVIDALEIENDTSKYTLPATGNFALSHKNTPQYFKSMRKVQDILALNVAFIMRPGDSFSAFYDISGSNSDGGVAISHSGSEVVMTPYGNSGSYYWGSEVKHSTSKPTLIVVNYLGVYVNSTGYKAANYLPMFVTSKSYALFLSGSISSDMHIRGVLNADCGVTSHGSPIDSYYNHGVFEGPIDLAGEILT